MVAPTPGDMDKCTPKCVCPEGSGPYSGNAFVCTDPCSGKGSNCTFDCQNGCVCPCSDPDEIQGTVYSQTITLSSGASYNNILTFGSINYRSAIFADGDAMCYGGSNTYVRCSDCPTCPRAGQVVNLRRASGTNTYCSQIDNFPSPIVYVSNVEEVNEICCEPPPSS